MYSINFINKKIIYSIFKNANFAKKPIKISRKLTMRDYNVHKMVS